jgi:hypothetical protein
LKIVIIRVPVGPAESDWIVALVEEGKGYESIRQGTRESVAYGMNRTYEVRALG